MHYPRDMVGYGKQPPNPRWPQNANIAVQFVINYEEGAENCILHGDQSSEAFLSEIVGANPWPNQRHWNMESIYEYGARSGFWRLYRIFTDSQIPVTVFGVANALARSPEQVLAMKNAKWEIASHGLKWIDYKDVTPTQEKYDLLEAIEIHKSVTGLNPSGWYLGRCSMSTVEIATQYGNFEYISDAYNDDLPYWKSSENKNQLIIPYSLDANDMRFATAQGFNCGSQFYDYLKDTFDLLLLEGRNGSPKMMNIGLHCRLAGRPGRANAIKRFVNYISKVPDVWVARRIDIARHWKKYHPPKNPITVPFDLNKSDFISIFGNVFENSPWIAERTFNKEVSPSMNRAVGLFEALSFQFRIASKDERLSVLREHPDLAGKLAAAKQLTKESSKEQQSAGLDQLSVTELKEFTKLNTRYTKKFGHPFIMAVTGKAKNEILRVFYNRIDNEPEKEIETACKEVEKIAAIRIKQILNN
ncbi:MAG: polysaccharide deacetylase [Rhodobacteraceae bacterium]|nr:MAG: polysaccharide deacetylase [Paracoccaceae bacterium]